MIGEHFWGEFITCFGPHTIRAWPRVCSSEWKDIILHKGIYIDRDRKRSPQESAFDILYRGNQTTALAKRRNRALVPQTEVKEMLKILS